MQYANDHDLMRAEDLRFKKNQPTQARKMANAIKDSRKALGRFEAMKDTFGLNANVVYPFAIRAKQLNYGTIYADAVDRGIRDGKHTTGPAVQNLYDDETANSLYQVAFRVARKGLEHEIMYA